MGKAYSLDLRERIITDYDEGLRPSQIWRKYRVSESWIYKLLRQRRETGCIKARDGHGGRKSKIAGHSQALKAIVEKHPDATLAEIRDYLGIEVSIPTVWKALRQLQLTFKKSPKGQLNSNDLTY
jgi:transposase